MLESFEFFKKRFMGHYYTPPKEIIIKERNITQKESIKKLLKEKAITQLTGYKFPQTFKSDEEVKNMLQGVI